MTDNLIKNITPPGKLKHVTRLFACLLATVVPLSVLAETDWSSLTIDNDVFYGSDDGYTGGFYYSWIDTPANNRPEIGLLAKAMRWSLSNRDLAADEYSIKTVGQAAVTPDDLDEKHPPLPPDDFPYGGLLFYSDTWLRAYAQQAEKIDVTIGIVGEYSFAEEVQKGFHTIIDATDPKGWDTQLNDEIVFRLSRAQMWRSWVSANGSSDLLLSGDAALGTVSSSVGVGAMVRFGEQLERNYATALQITSRAANPISAGPISVQSGWYYFAGVNATYLANQIFLDGNTFDNDDQQSMDYDNEMIGATVGAVYSWQNWALTFAMTDMNLIESNDHMDDYNQFGSLTLAWRND
jgi:lipid A 3-O-deacylase